MTTDLITFTYDGNDVTFDPSVQMWNLNAMHKAAGSDPNKAPRFWLRQEQTQELIAALQRKLNCDPDAQFIDTREGRNGGTWTVQQLAIVYAHYLNPDFYLQWNEWALAHVTGQHLGQPDRLTAIEQRLAALEGRRTSLQQVSAVAVPSREAQEVFEVLQGLGGRATSEQMHQALPHVTFATLRKRLWRQSARGTLRCICRGVYELVAQPEA